MALYSKRTNNNTPIAFGATQRILTELNITRTLDTGGVLLLLHMRISNSAAAARTPEFVFTSNGNGIVGPIAKVTIPAAGQETLTFAHFLLEPDPGPTTFSVRVSPDTDPTQTAIQFRTVFTVIQFPNWDDSPEDISV